MFIGAESINLASKDAKNAKSMIPKAYVLSAITLVLLSFPIIFVVSSSSPGVTVMKTKMLALTFPMADSFGITIDQARLLQLPASYGIIYGFTFAYSRQWKSMGASGILNPWLAKTSTITGAPYAALLAGGALVLVFCTTARFDREMGRRLYDISILFAVMAYIAQMIGFIHFRIKLSTIKRRYSSPLGVYGAIYSIFVFSLVAISLIGMQPTYVPLIVCAGYICFITVYYYFVVKNRQFFSKEEQQVLFIAHVCKSKSHTDTNM